MNKYVQFPNYIIEKWNAGLITNTHMTDLLRLELLIRYGGMWVDATVLCTSRSKNIPKYYFDSELFFYQCLKPGRDGHCNYISSWLISAKTNNKNTNGNTIFVLSVLERKQYNVGLFFTP